MQTFIHGPRGVIDLREGMEGFSSRKRVEGREGGWKKDENGKLSCLILGEEP